MIKKIIILVTLFLVLNPHMAYSASNTENYDNSSSSASEIINSQKSSLNIKEFLDAAEEYTKDVFTDTDFDELLSDAISGKIDNKKIGNSFLQLLGKETVSSIRTIGLIIIIIVIHSILKAICDNLENKGISQMVYYVQYILIVTLLMSNFTDIVSMVKESITNLVGFSNTLVPLLMTLILTTGNITTAGIIQPVLLFIITFIGNFILDFVIPIILTFTVLGIVSKISDKVQLEKLSKFFKSAVVWVLGVTLTAFVTFISIEGNLGSSVDAFTAKTTKAAVSTFIPVVGKILGDAVDTVIGCAGILKNAVGVVGVVVILGICIMPIIKLVILMATYYLGAAICQPIASPKVVKLLEQMGDTFKILLAILCVMAVLLIIGTTLVMKISNSGLIMG